MKNTFLLNITLTFFFTVMVSSCATIFYGTSENVMIYSNPPGAEVIVNGKKSNMVTPCQINIERRVAASQYNSKNQYCYQLKKEGYQDQFYCDKSRLNPVAIVDMFFYFVPFVVDIATGASRAYETGINATLLPLQNQNQTNYSAFNPQPIINTSSNSEYTFKHKSDVDVIANSGNQLYTNRYALIIGNEDYTSQQKNLASEANVAFARNDASAMKEYAINILGIPERNVFFLLDATTGRMKQEIDKMSLLAKNSNGNAELFFYYAGHGLPDEVTREPYLIPVDVSGSSVSEGIKLSDIYDKLTFYSSKKVTVVLDACFSGGARNQGLISARGVKIRPKDQLLKGNLVVFAASSNDQSSLSYKEQEHGLFTYYFLKKLKDSKDNLTYKELSDYLIQEIGINSLIINSKEQNPQTNFSPEIEDQWQTWKLR